MRFASPIVKVGAKGWTAVDAGPDGALVGVSVRYGTRAGARPKVVKCARSASGAPGAKALAELAHRVSVSGFPWTLPLKRGDYRLLVVPEPPVLAGEMDQSLRWVLGSMVDFPIDEAGVAWMHIPTTEFQPDLTKHIYAVVAPKSAVDAQTALFQKAKLKLRAVDVRETAQRNIAALLEKKGEGLALLHVGPDGVTITFTFGGELYLDRFIEQPLDKIVSADRAGEQKIFERLTLQVLRSIELLSRNFPFLRVDRVVLAPLPAPMGLHEHLSQHLPAPVELLDLASVFDLSRTPELRAPEHQARYFVALGAALRGVRKEP
jgi:MSHA biogenesis protein MshI